MLQKGKLGLIGKEEKENSTLKIKNKEIKS